MTIVKKIADAVWGFLVAWGEHRAKHAKTGYGMY